MKILILPLICLFFISCNKNNQYLNESSIISGDSSKTNEESITGLSKSTTLNSVNGLTTVLFLVKSKTQSVSINHIHFGNTHQDDVDMIMSDYIIEEGEVSEEIIEFKYDEMDREYSSSEYNQDITTFLGGRYVILEFHLEEFPGENKTEYITIQYSLDGLNDNNLKEIIEVSNQFNF